MPGRLLITLLFAIALGWSELCSAEQSKITQLDLEPLDSMRQREVPLRITFKVEQPSQPVVLFSPGLGGARTNYGYLSNVWAAQGYVCVFMQHAGSDHNVWLEAPLMEKLQALKEAANARNSLERVRDVNFVIDQLERWNVEPSHPLHGKLDLEHIGMAGHSFGAVTTLSVAGQKYPLGKQFTEKRIDAFLAMSPQTGESGLMARRVFEEIATPVLCMTGTRDDSPIDKRVTPATRREVFAGLPPGNKYELVFDGGHHFTFGDTSGFRTRSRDADHHPAIERISTEFWNAYLRDDLQAKQWLQSELPRDACKLKSKDVWQWK